MSIPVSETYENEDTFVSHTGPLRLQRPTQFEHMSGPLYSNQRAEKPTWTKLGKQNSIAHAIMPEEIRRNDWSYHNDIGRNEHLLKSGPLGLCNNPDCTDCPAAYKKTKRHYYGSPASLDSKVLFPLTDVTRICLLYCLYDVVVLLQTIPLSLVVSWKRFK